MTAILKLREKIQSKISRIIYDRKKAIKRGKINEASMLGMDKGILDHVIQLIDKEIQDEINRGWSISPLWKKNQPSKKDSDYKEFVMCQKFEIKDGVPFHWFEKVKYYDIPKEGVVWFSLNDIEEYMGEKDEANANNEDFRKGKMR